MQRITRKAALMALTGVVEMVLLLAVACTGGVSQSDYDAVKQQLADQEKKTADVQQELSKQAAAPKSAPPVIGSIPNAPPRATPTPTPAGFVAPPPPPLVAPDVKALFLDVNTTTAGQGESKYNVDADKLCATTSVFRRGMHIVWLMEAYEASTGKELQTPDVKTAVLKLPNGDTANFRYGRHGATADSPWFWSAAWDVPPDYPLGVLDYEVTVTSVADKQGSFKVWGAHAPERNITNRLTIID